MKILLVGDLHVQANNINDTIKIFNFIEEILAKDSTISLVVFLGDIFHTHDILKQEPAFVVRKAIENLKKIYAQRVDWIFLAGNHDYSSPAAVTADNAVRLVLGDLVRVVDGEIEICGGMDFIPFVGNNEKFIEMCKRSSNEILFCHQTFDGSRYENNQTAPNGVNQNDIPHKLIISGHIHTKQTLKNEHNTVFYVGTPRALTANEVNQNKYLTTYDTETEMLQDFPTNHLVKEFIAINLNQGDSNVVVSKTWKDGDDVRIHVSGNQEFYDQVLDLNSHLAGQVRFIPDIRKELTKILDIDSNAMNIDQAFRKYVYEVVDMSDEMRDAVWMKAQKLIPQLGINP